MSPRRDAAIIRLANLRVRQGRLEEAGRLLEGLEQHPDVAPPLAALHEEGNLDDAERVARRLDRLAAAQRGPYLRAVAALAKGRVGVAGGQGDARACLQEALEGFARAQLPMELARTRLELARALTERAPEVAIAEAKAALEEFERLQAARHADAARGAAALARRPHSDRPQGIGALTRREAEVLQLIGAGLSNAEIGERLYMSRKTVEHHVGHVLSKLGLRNRAEAAPTSPGRRSAPE